jgi:hypothetical protein
MALKPIGRTLRAFGALLASAMLLVGCDGQERRDAEIAAAPIRLIVDGMASNPTRKVESGQCICAGFRYGHDVKNFPAGILDDEYSGHPWFHRWSSCPAPEGTIALSPFCPRGAAYYVCSVTDRSHGPNGAAVVQCRVYIGTLNGYVEGWDVTRKSSGGFDVKATGLDEIK